MHFTAFSQLTKIFLPALSLCSFYQHSLLALWLLVSGEGEDMGLSFHIHVKSKLADVSTRIGCFFCAWPSGAPLIYVYLLLVSLEVLNKVFSVNGP